MQVKKNLFLIQAKKVLLVRAIVSAKMGTADGARNFEVHDGSRTLLAGPRTHQ